MPANAREQPVGVLVSEAFLQSRGRSHWQSPGRARRGGRKQGTRILRGVTSSRIIPGGRPFYLEMLDSDEMEGASYRQIHIQGYLNQRIDFQCEGYTTQAVDNSVSLDSIPSIAPFLFQSDLGYTETWHPWMSKSSVFGGTQSGLTYTPEISGGPNTFPLVDYPNSIAVQTPPSQIIREWEIWDSVDPYSSNPSAEPAPRKMGLVRFKLSNPTDIEVLYDSAKSDCTVVDLTPYTITLYPNGWSRVRSLNEPNLSYGNLISIETHFGQDFSAYDGQFITRQEVKRTGNGSSWSMSVNALGQPIISCTHAQFSYPPSDPFSVRSITVLLVKYVMNTVVERTVYDRFDLPRGQWYDLPVPDFLPNPYTSAAYEILD